LLKIIAQSLQLIRALFFCGGLKKPRPAAPTAQVIATIKRKRTIIGRLRSPKVASKNEVGSLTADARENQVAENADCESRIAELVGTAIWKFARWPQESHSRGRPRIPFRNPHFLSVCLGPSFGRRVLFRQGLWITDLQTPPGQECSNGSMLCVAVVL